VPKQASTTRRRRGHALIVSGYGVRIHVSRGRLVVADGIGEDRQERVYPRVGQNISRVVVLAQDGSISLAAVRWLAGLGIPYLHLDRDGRLLAESSRVRLDDPRLRRAQALAGTSPVGVAVAREVIIHKIRGQRSVVEYLGGDPTTIDPPLEVALAASCLDEVRRAESTAALAYWASWSGLAVQFHGRDEDTVPAHWRRFVRRGSDITGNPRSATDPTNAILNYLYAILEAETTIACRAIGLDPGLGIVHLDAPARASLALDVMEAARPDVDRYVVDLLRNRVFAARDFMETAQGVCRVMPPLRDVLAGTVTTWAGHIAPHVEEAARRLASDAGIGAPPTPLTGQRRRTARAQRLTIRARPCRPSRRGRSGDASSAGPRLAGTAGAAMLATKPPTASDCSVSRRQRQDAERRPTFTPAAEPTCARALGLHSVSSGSSGYPRTTLTGSDTARAASFAWCFLGSLGCRRVSLRRRRGFRVGTARPFAMGSGYLIGGTGRHFSLPAYSTGTVIEIVRRLPRQIHSRRATPRPGQPGRRQLARV
jgi:CRISPR-associated endonuclease Cas1